MERVRDDRSLYDLLMQVFGPILIMSMVASLVFFSIEVFYRGPHVGRLYLIMLLFTIATVLVSRISIEGGLERAAMFAGGLGLATFMTTSVIVDFEYGRLALLEPVVIGVFVMIVMWMSNRLTWDCTLFGRSRDVSAVGLTEVVRQRLLGRRQASPEPKPTAADDQSKKPFSFAQFMLGGGDESNTPGLWVFYLSLAAFPVFGLGQWFVPSRTDGFSVFFLFAVYLTSGLGLLMLTSLLGLKRYVNERGVKVPVPIAMNWLAIGTVFAVGLLLLIALLPRPNLSGRFQDYLAFLTTENRNFSQLAVGNDGDPQDAEGKPVKGDQKGDPENQKQVDGQGEANDPNSSAKKSGGGKGEKDKSTSKSKSKSDSKSGKSDSKSSQSKSNSKSDSNQQKSNDSKSQKSNDSKSSNQKDSDSDTQNQSDQNTDSKPKPNQQNANRDQDGKKRQQRDQQANKNDQAKPQQQARDNRNQQQVQQRQQRNQNRNQPDNANRQQNQFANQLQPNFDPAFSKWIAYLLAGILLAVVAVLYRDEIARWWRSLFEKNKSKSETNAQPAIEPVIIRRPKPFRAFSNPFASGQVQHWSVEQLYQYTFVAMESWAYEHGAQRMPDQTLEEFVNQLTEFTGDQHAAFEKYSQRFSGALFGRKKLLSADGKLPKRIWQTMLSNPPMARTTVSTAV